MKKQNNNGITLIALVITIIVLLILAGVSIAMLTGPNGLLTQADTAKTKTTESGAKEKVEIAVAGSYGEGGFNPEDFKKEIIERFKGEITSGDKEFPIKVTMDGYNFEISEVGVVTEKGGSSSTTPPPVGDTVTPGVKVTGSNKTYENNGTAVIPVGFAIVPDLDDVSQGLVISDKENDINNEGNQFVWIPVTDPNSYVRNYDFPNDFNNLGEEQIEIKNDESYLPTFNEGEKVPDGSSELEKEKNLVTSKGGFYISRYEAGDASAQTNRKKSSGTIGKLVSKKDAYVYNYISQIDAKEKAKTFEVEDSKKVKSGLITGIQWDMVMSFITKELPRKDGNGEDYIVTEVKSTRHHDSGVEQSGQNEADRVCNIYDLEGNFYEYVAEKNSSRISYVSRGGSYFSNAPACCRNLSDGTAYSLDSRYVSFCTLCNVGLRYGKNK